MALIKVSDVSLGYDGTILVEFTYPGFKRGFPCSMKKDIAKLKKLI
jgi:hypothetical protein